MKKKILLILLLFVTVFTLSGCTKEEKKYEGENAFDNYTGIFRNGNSQIKIINIDETIKFRYKKDVSDDLSTEHTDSGYLEENKIGTDEYEMEFSKDSIKIKVKSKDFEMVAGEYKRYANYSAEEIYKDILDVDFVKDGKYNTLYTFGDNKLYVVDVDSKTIRIKAISEGADVSINLEKESDDKYSTDFFGTKYEITFKDDTATLFNDSKDENDLTLNGTYKKESSISIKDAIKVFADN